MLRSVNFPVYAWLAVGRKVTEILQLLPGARDAGQLPRLGLMNGRPDVEIGPKTSAAVPEFVTVSCLVVFVLIRCTLKSNEVAVEWLAGTEPVPIRATVAGDPAALWS